jgi:MoaE-MoaD fusion protein
MPLVTVRLFGPMARAVDRPTVEVMLDTSAATCADLRAKLAACQPRLAPLLPACRFAVNQQLAPDQQAIGPGDEIALIGLVSGG